jgi:hypothetical protein
MSDRNNDDRRIGDHVRQGSWADLRKTLGDLERQLRSAGDALFHREDLQEGCRVYPAIARSTADQIQLLATHAEERIEITAGVCRLVFEMNVVLRYCLSSQARLMAYADQSVTDEISTHKAIKQLAHSGTNPITIHAIDQRIAELRDLMSRHDRNLSPERCSTAQMAKEVGLQEDYDALYGLYSKYVHASAWFVLRPRGHTDTAEYRMLMQIRTQVYANDTLHRLNELAGLAPR